MSNNYSASSFHVIGEHVIKKIRPTELEAFNVALGECAEGNSTAEVEVSVDDVFADYARQDLLGDTDYTYPDKMPRVKRALETLQETFSAATGGLVLRPGHVDGGLPGSDLSEESFWFIDNATIHNPIFTALVTEHKLSAWAKWHLDCEQ